MRTLKCANCKKELAEIYESPIVFSGNTVSETILWSATGISAEKYNYKNGITKLQCAWCGTKYSVVKRKGRTYIRKVGQNGKDRAT